MRALSVGRNDSCPCGSGKKFKRCCLGKESGAAPAQAAASASEALHNALKGHQFNSLEEAQAFVTRHVEMQNQRPLEEFHGLSPDQMRRIMDRPFNSPELVRFPESLDLMPTAPILQLFALLADAIGEQGLKPTAKGNLPRNFCREAAQAYWGDETYQDNTRYGGINREEDFFDLHVTRMVAELAGLIRKYRGRFILSRDCRKLLTDGGLGAIYPRLFRTYVEKFNWAYRDGYPELHLIQSASLFTLYLLTLCGDVSRSQAFYEQAFLRAFPMLLDELPANEVGSPEETVRSCYTWRALVNLARFLGLATVESTSDDILNREYRVKSLPLLGQIVQFQLPK